MTTNNFVSLPPATKLGQGYVFTGVCDSVNRGGVYLSACWDTPPGGRHPLGADTPQSRQPREQTPPRADTDGNRHHPMGADPPPPEQTSPGADIPPSRQPPGADTPQSRHPPSRPPTEHAGRYGQRAGGTHPTGMQSCFVQSLLNYNLIFGFHCVW